MGKPTPAASRQPPAFRHFAARSAAAAFVLSLVASAPVRLPAAGADRARSPEELIEASRSEDLFTRKRAEGELRRSGAAALPALARSLEDPHPDLALRLWPVFRDLLRASLDQLDADALARERETKEREALRSLRAELPKTIARLREELAVPPPAEEDPEKVRRAAVERDEKSQKLRASEEALRDADARVAEIEPRLPERTKRVEESRERVVKLGAAAFGAISARRESVLLELLPFYDGLLDSLRAGLDEGAFPEKVPAGAAAAAAGKPRDRDDFERRRYLLSTVWAREVDRKGPLAARASPLLAEHLRRTIEDLRRPTGRRELAEQDLYALARRGREALEAASDPAGGERLRSLLLFRVEPRLAERTGIDFRDYRGLAFRDRRRLLIHYARVAGRDAVPTLRLIALDEGFEPSLRVRLAAAEALAGPNIRDRSAILAFERLSLPELIKIPEIARNFAIINGHQFLEEKRYAEAIEEFRKVLDESPYDFRANYGIAMAYLLIKDFAKAILHFEISRRIDPKDTFTLYNLSCAYSLDRQTEKALEMLSASVQAGFDDAKHIEEDPDLEALRQDPRFHEILDRLRQGPKTEERPPAKDEDR